MQDFDYYMKNAIKGLKVRQEIYPLSKGKAYDKAIQAAREISNFLVKDIDFKLPERTNTNKIISIKDTSPVFICGMPKSGTTLISQLLDHHPQLLVFPGEGHYENSLRKKDYYGSNIDQILKHWLKHFFISIRTYPRLTLGDKYYRYANFSKLLYFLLLYTETPPFICAVAALSSLYPNADKFKYWTEKTPGNELYSDLLLKHHPDAKFINIVRHPLQNIVSFQKWRIMRNGISDLKTLIKSTKNRLGVTVKNYAKYGPEKYHIVLYENLVSNTEVEMRKISEFLNIPFRNELLKPTELGHSAVSNSMYKKNIVKGKVLDLSKRISSELTENQKNEILKALSKEIKYFWK